MDKGQWRPASKGNKYGHYERSFISLWTPERPQPKFSLNRNASLDMEWSHYSLPEQQSISPGDAQMVSICYSSSTGFQPTCSSQHPAQLLLFYNSNQGQCTPRQRIWSKEGVDTSWVRAAAEVLSCLDRVTNTRVPSDLKPDSTAAFQWACLSAMQEEVHHHHVI